MSTENQAGGTLGHTTSIPLRALANYEVADGYPDIRGWEVVTAAGDGAGRVEELLVDTDALRVSHVVVTANGRRTMVPVDKVELQADGRRIFVSDTAAMRDVPTSGNPRTDAVAAAIGVDPEVLTVDAKEEEAERRRPIVDGAVRAEDLARNELRVPLLGVESLREPEARLAEGREVEREPERE
jgi:hypothetical protein